ncbi:MarP family serine protease [Streptomyces sp. INA 01156]
MDLLDLLLLLFVLAYAASGYRRGLLAGCVSLAGFVGGAVVGVWILPWVLGSVDPGTTTATVTAVFTVLLLAAVGHELAWLALRLRRELDRGPLRVADGIGGAAANSVAVLIVAWVVASVLGASSSPLVTSAIRDSRLLGAVNEVMPDTTPAWFSRATSELTEAGFPQVFNPFENESTAEVAEPSGDSVTAAATRAAQRSTVKVEGVAGLQGREGSGFVYATERVMTNAHVVAGIDRPTVRVGGVGRAYEARVVLFDPQKDVAVLYVPNCGLPSSGSTTTPAAATRRSSRAIRRTAIWTCGRRRSRAGCRRRARTSTATGRPSARSTRSVPSCARQLRRPAADHRRPGVRRGVRPFHLGHGDRLRPDGGRGRRRGAARGERHGAGGHGRPDDVVGPRPGGAGGQRRDRPISTSST